MKTLAPFYRFFLARGLCVAVLTAGSLCQVAVANTAAEDQGATGLSGVTGIKVANNDQGGKKPAKKRAKKPKKGKTKAGATSAGSAGYDLSHTPAGGLAGVSIFGIGAYESIKAAEASEGYTGFGVLGGSSYHLALNEAALVGFGGGLRYSSVSAVGDEYSTSISALTAFFLTDFIYMVTPEVGMGLAIDLDLMTLSGSVVNKFGDVTTSGKLDKFSRTEILARLLYKFSDSMSFIADVGKDSASVTVTLEGMDSATGKLDGMTVRGGLAFAL